MILILTDHLEISMPTKSAKPIQAKSEVVVEKPAKVEEEILAVTIRLDNSFEYHLNIPRSVVEGILDPDVDDAFLKVPSPLKGSRRFVHTSKVKDLDVRGL